MLSDKDFILEALKEDIRDGDITANATIPESKNVQAKLISKETGILAGTKYFSMVFELLDSQIQVHWKKEDSDEISNGEILAVINGNAKNILAGERTALNLLQHLSGIASKTNQVTKMLEKTNIQVLDTRKTLPLYRKFQKEAVLAGGGKNHRFGLYDMFLIKENHIAVAGSIQKAIESCRSLYPEKSIEIETQNIEEVHEAVKYGADIIMLDNMSRDEIIECGNYIREHSNIKIENSGNITLKRIPDLIDLPIDYISMGSLTHSVKAFDISLLIED